ncbi:protein DEHYDRATION-INDUCED 19 homolog 4 isoform X2 [Aegilops tauschii subsp. strangulata]|uniref:Protein dehydration-induced 19 C-terminal domain-containing protein n=1 Tax=Aegilops tauschii subsp. strangulata TaxID=200361 RepID=A0A453JZF4_AEGTS|nr:protein DEHYDRATION-INDUCED 19 homolog 2 isoform X2 [Aegilops tauschii subsp. strangulata]
MDMGTFERLQAETRLRDALMRLEEAEETDDDEERGAEEEELECPFCGEEFDGVGLCLHIEDEHAAETKAGGRWRNQRVSSGSPSSMYSALKKDAAHIQYRYGGSSRATSLNTVPDPLLSSFVGSFIDDDADSRKDAQEELLEKVIEKSDASEQKAEESAEEPLLPEEKEERTKRSQFVQGLVLSLMFDDIL